MLSLLPSQSGRSLPSSPAPPFLFNDFLAFFDQPQHAFAWFYFGLFAKELEYLLEAFNLVLVSSRWVLNACWSSGEGAALTIFGKAFTNGSLGMKAAFVRLRHGRHAGTRATQAMEFPFAPPATWLLSFAAPDKGGGVLVPMRGYGDQPLVNLPSVFRRLSIQSAPLQDALHRFGHVAPTAAKRCVQRHDAMCAHNQSTISALLCPAQLSHTSRAHRGALFSFRASRCSNQPSTGMTIRASAVRPHSQAALLQLHIPYE